MTLAVPGEFRYEMSALPGAYFLLTLDDDKRGFSARLVTQEELLVIFGAPTIDPPPEAR